MFYYTAICRIVNLLNTRYKFFSSNKTVCLIPYHIIKKISAKYIGHLNLQKCAHNVHDIYHTQHMLNYMFGYIKAKDGSSEHSRLKYEYYPMGRRLWPVYATLGEYHLMNSSHTEEFKSLDRRGRLTEGLKEFIAENKI